MLDNEKGTKLSSIGTNIVFLNITTSSANSTNMSHQLLTGQLSGSLCMETV